MKATLEFNLDNPEDAMDHRACIKAKSMAIVLFHATQNMRKQMINDKTPNEYIEGVDDTINAIRELMYDNGIIIDDLIE